MPNPPSCCTEANFPRVTHIYCSPMKRTICTALLAFQPYLKPGMKVIMMEDLREIGKGSPSTGSSLKELKTTLEKYPVDLSSVKKYWEEGAFYDDIDARVLRTKKSLYKIAKEAILEIEGDVEVCCYHLYIRQPRIFTSLHGKV